MFAKTFQSAILLALVLLTSACSKTFIVSDDFPEPLVSRAQTVVLMQYSEKFKNYEFSEKARDRPLERVAIGPAQVNLFNQVFSSLFVLAETTNEPVGLIIEPQIIDLQYSAPSETKLNLYEVWLKYRVIVIDSNEEEIADWVVKGYGKTPTATLGSYLKAFDTASNIALRDVGAQLAIGFRTQPSIQEYLIKKSKVDINMPVRVARILLRVVF